MSAAALKGVRQAAKRRDRADDARRQAVRDQREQVRAAKTAGVPISRIAREAGLSRQGVYDLLADPPPS